MVVMETGQCFGAPKKSEPFSNPSSVLVLSLALGLGKGFLWTGGLGLELELDKNSQLLCEEEGASGNGRHLEHNKHRDWNEKRHTLLCSDSLAI